VPADNQRKRNRLTDESEKERPSRKRFLLADLRIKAAGGQWGGAVFETRFSPVKRPEKRKCVYRDDDFEGSCPKKRKVEVEIDETLAENPSNEQAAPVKSSPDQHAEKQEDDTASFDGPCESYMDLIENGPRGIRVAKQFFCPTRRIYWWGDTGQG
jgi:hypothetical protein